MGKSGGLGNRLIKTGHFLTCLGLRVMPSGHSSMQTM
jgi:hypothetical protein